MRGRIFYPKDQINECKEFPAKTTSSTLLIPARNMELYLTRLEDFENSPTDYLTYLLKSYGFWIRNGILAKNSKLETAYQEEGLDLQRVDFVPKGEDWAELKCLRIFLNRSMTWIFVQLLLLDSLEIAKHLPEKLADFGVPKISQFRVMVKVILSRKLPLYTRILRHTRDKAG
ncbi:MAG TPA: DUF1564 family protein [Leptospiraceae bacterium]|nr:DUF1564 family protein [Leptospiraceae bacterium]HRG73653.1 DUF1564 family protein [Leptospiraceae bacterium]